MTLQGLQHALTLAEPYREGDYCLGAEHDALTIALKRIPPDEIVAQLKHITGVALSWLPEEDDEDGVIVDYDNPTITCFV